MAYQDHSGGYPPPRDSRDYSESQYPPPPGEEDDRARAYHHQRIPSAPGSVTLPSISPYGVPNGYAPDPRGYQQPPYREPPPGAYRDDRGYPPQDYGRGAPQHMAFSQSAPRQRTAIACRYCRRRKIRCSGFDQNPEGRCSNCQRFQQECIFTPVSSQAQAFVPAHAVYPNMRNMGVGPDGRPRPMGGFNQPTQLFGAHGQPLGPSLHKHLLLTATTRCLPPRAPTARSQMIVPIHQTANGHSRIPTPPSSRLPFPDSQDTSVRTALLAELRLKTTFDYRRSPLPAVQAQVRTTRRARPHPPSPTSSLLRSRDCHP